MITICCVCGKVKHPHGWEEATSPVTDEIPSHGYCPDCFEQARLELLLMLVKDWTRGEADTAVA